MRDVFRPRTLREAIHYFSDSDRCLRLAAVLRWPGGTACPACGLRDVRFLTTRQVWKCRDPHPRRQFSVKVGTIFEDSAVGLDKWFAAIWAATNAPNAVSSYRTARELGVTQKTAWHMMDRIRRATHSASFDSGILGVEPVVIRMPGGDGASRASMKSHTNRGGAPPDGLERFERLARGLFGVRKQEIQTPPPPKLAVKATGRRKRGFLQNARRLAMQQRGAKKTLKCSFCGKSEEHVTYLLAGGNSAVYICGGCVNICVDIINKTRASSSALGPA